MRQGGYSYVVMMLMIKAVGNKGVRRVEIFGGGGKGERNRR